MTKSKHQWFRLLKITDLIFIPLRSIVSTLEIRTDFILFPAFATLNSPSPEPSPLCSVGAHGEAAKTTLTFQYFCYQAQKSDQFLRLFSSNSAC
jgi:hypothetical protein